MRKSRFMFINLNVRCMIIGTLAMFGMLFPLVLASSTVHLTLGDKNEIGLKKDSIFNQRILVVSNVYAHIYYFSPSKKLESKSERDQFLMNIVKLASLDIEECSFIEKLNKCIKYYSPSAHLNKIIPCNEIDSFSKSEKKQKFSKHQNEYLYWKHIGPGRDQFKFTRVGGGFDSKLIHSTHSEVETNINIPRADSIYYYEICNKYKLGIKHSVQYNEYNQSTKIDKKYHQIEKYGKRELNIENYNYRIANLIFLYSVLKFFQAYPQMNEIPLDSVLLISIKRTANDSDKDSFISTLKYMSTYLNDCHSGVQDKTVKKSWVIPYLSRIIENQVVVIGVCKPSKNPISVGDRILTIDNIPVFEKINHNINYISGCSSKYRMLCASIGIRRFYNNKPIKIEYLDKDNNFHTVIQRKYKARKGTLDCLNKQSIVEIDSSIYYLNMDRLSSNKIVPLLAQSKGIIFDLRGYLLNEEIFYHLIDSIIYSDSFIVPISYFPEISKNKLIDYSRWKIIPQKPSLTNIPIVFITDENAMSYSESWLSIIKQEQLGTIIGSNSAACNGNIAEMILPCEIMFGFSAIKVITHDGKIYQGNGTKPDLYIEPTIKSIQSGEDLLILKALDIIRSKIVY